MENKDRKILEEIRKLRKEERKRIVKKQELISSLNKVLENNIEDSKAFSKMFIEMNDFEKASIIRTDINVLTALNHLLKSYYSINIF